jgi:hypothetical protein
MARTGRWKKPFLKALAETGNVSIACKVARVERSTAYDHQNEKHAMYDAAFAKAWSDALETAADILEAEARRRGFEGWDEPVFGSGGPGQGTVQVGTVRKYSDALLIVLLKSVRPHKFREHYHFQQNNQQNNNIVVNWDEFLDLARLPSSALISNGQQGNGQANGPQQVDSPA